MINKAIIIFIKECSAEVRFLSSSLVLILYSLSACLAVSFANYNAVSSPESESAFLWIILYFSAIAACSRSFTKEEEQLTADLLRLSAPAESIFIGKFLFNFVILLLLEIITVPIFVILNSCVISDIGLFSLELIFAALAISSALTLTSAMASHAKNKNMLTAVISFPILIPCLLAAININAYVFGAGDQLIAMSSLRILFYCFGISISAGLLLFRFVWRDN